MPTFTAVDLGATSGRVVNVRIDGTSIASEPIHRFPTVQTGAGDQLVWDFDRLLADVRAGLADAGASGPIESVAVDGWGVDYGLLGSNGRRLGPVHAYRSTRTAGVMEDVGARIGRDRIYRATGIQFLPFNTAYQLVAGKDSLSYRAATRLLMVPDLVNHALCGSVTNEVTNASTTQLLDAATHDWSDELLDRLGLRRDLLPDLHQPGTGLGEVAGVGAAVDGVPVVAAASHDTASAVVGAPLEDDRPGIYISCGTWALVGAERPASIVSDAALAANVTNELGVDGTARVLKNVTGLWLLEECRRHWASGGQTTDVGPLLAEAERTPGGRMVFDPDHPSLATPGDIPTRIASLCVASGQPAPVTPGEMTRSILDSLALKWRTTVATIEAVTGVRGEVIHLVGGGSAIPLLAHLCASALDRPVLAGPVEATTLGNAIVQAVASGALASVAAGHDLVRRTGGVVEVSPESTLDWDELGLRYDASPIGR